MLTKERAKRYKRLMRIGAIALTIGVALLVIGAIAEARGHSKSDFSVACSAFILSGVLILFITGLALYPKGMGILIIFGGSLGLVAALSMDITADGKIVNLGLIADRQNYLIASGFAILVGMGVFGFGVFAESQSAAAKRGQAIPVALQPEEERSLESGEEAKANDITGGRLKGFVGRLLTIGAYPGRMLNTAVAIGFGIACASPNKMSRILKRAAGDENQIIYWFFVAIVVALLTAAIGVFVALLVLLSEVWLSWPVAAMLCGLALMFIGGGYEKQPAAGAISTAGMVCLLVALPFATRHLEEFVNNARSPSTIAISAAEHSGISHIQRQVAVPATAKAPTDSPNNKSNSEQTNGASQAVPQASQLPQSESKLSPTSVTDASSNTASTDAMPQRQNPSVQPSDEHKPTSGTIAGSLDKSPTSSRTWSDASGLHKIEAELVSAEAGTVTLKTASGRVITIPLEQLSKDDQQFVESHATATQPVQGWPPYFKAPLVRIENDQSANAKRNDAAANSDSHAVGKRSKGATTADESLPLPNRAIETINFVSGFCGRLHEQIDYIVAANDTSEQKTAALGKAVQGFKAEMAGKQLSFCFRIRDVVPSGRGYELLLGKAEGIKKDNNVALELPEMSIPLDRNDALKAAKGDVLVLSGNAILTAWIDSRIPTKRKNWLTMLTTSVHLDHKHGGHLGNFSIDLTDHTFKIEHRVGTESASYSGGIATASSSVQASQKPSVQPASQPTIPQSTTSSLPLAATKIIELSDREQFALILGKLRKGTKLTFQYVSGKWKDWGKSPTESPDTESPERGDQCRVAIVSHPFRDQATVLAIVPANTQSQPFEWVCPADLERVVLRINSKLGDYAKHPGGVVRYRLTISAP